MARNWTTLELRELADMLARGASVQFCADALERSRGSVSGAKQRLGLAAPNLTRRRGAGELKRAVARMRGRMGATEMADALGVTRGVIYDAIRRLDSCRTTVYVTPRAKGRAAP